MEESAKRVSPFRSVFYHFNKWSKSGVIEKLNRALVAHDRQREDRDAEPSVLCIDCQLVKCGPMVSESKGLNGNKRVNGRGRTLLVDSGGRVLAVHVDAANVHDGKSGIALIKKLSDLPKQVGTILYDVAYNGMFAEYIRENHKGIIPKLSSKPPSEKGFVPLAVRWVSERQFGCLNFFRRLDKDHEKITKNAESMILLANIQMLLQISTQKAILSLDKKRIHSA
ncbi:MAG: transposase [Saprospiraceae bacterium]